MLPVPEHIPRPSYAETGKPPPFRERDPVVIHGPEGIRKMRAAGNLAARALSYGGSLVKPGITTDEIDKAMHKFIVDNNAYPSCLNYGEFPKSVCTSVNECVCHGIPDNRPLQDGDIINIDVTVYLDGYHGDNARNFYVGTVSPEAKKLCETTSKALDAAISICKPGVPYKEIGKVTETIAKENGFSIAKGLSGHGVGKDFHMQPAILHYTNNMPGVMQAGQTFTIEPILLQGADVAKTWDDGWTMVTKDGGLTAQCEHTILITDDGAEILTKC